MVIAQAQRAETAVTQMLAAASGCSAAVTDLRTALEMSKAIASKLAAFQARAAAVLAAREHHGDGGAGVLRHATGVSRRQAEGQARTARILDEMELSLQGPSPPMDSHISPRTVRAAAPRANPMGPGASPRPARGNSLRRNAAGRRKPPTCLRDSLRRNTLPPWNGRRRNARPRDAGNPGRLDESAPAQIAAPRPPPVPPTEPLFNLT